MDLDELTLTALVVSEQAEVDPIDLTPETKGESQPKQMETKAANKTFEKPIVIFSKMIDTNNESKLECQEKSDSREENVEKYDNLHSKEHDQIHSVAKKKDENKKRILGWQEQFE